MGGVVKPALRVCGEAIIERVVRAALRVARSVVVALSGYTLPLLKDYCGAPGVTACIELGGRGYPEDLRLAVNAVRARPLLVLPGDTPFITPRLLEWFIGRASRLDADLVTLVARGSGPLGVSLVKGWGWSWATIEAPASPELLNVNTWRDYAEAVGRCTG